jgi:hypothetical protein
MEPSPAARPLAVVAVLTALAAAYATRAADADLWGHLRYGRLIAENGCRVPPDPFAYASPGRPWTDHEWLAQVLLWRAYAAGGDAGLIALKCLLGGAALLCVGLALRLATGDPRLWGPLLMLAAVGLGRWFHFRPQLFTFALLALFVLLLLRHLLGRRSPLWLLPLLVPLWVNLHGGFLAGLGVVGLALALRVVQAPRETAPLALTFVACLAGSLLNPLGWRLWPYLVTELGYADNRRFIDEWLPLRFTTHFWTALLLTALLALAAAFVVVAEARRKRPGGLPPWAWLLSCVPLALMAFGSNRHAPICTLWTAPVVGVLAAAAVEGREGRSVPAVAALLLAVAAVPAALTAALVVAAPAPRIAVPPAAKAPDGLIAYLKENRLRGNVYAPLWWGSHLTWELYPDVLVALDGRNVTRFAPADVTANLSFYQAEGADPDTPSRYPTDFLAVPSGAPVLGRLRGDRRWRAVYEDDDVTLFAREGAGPAR